MIQWLQRKIRFHQLARQWQAATGIALQRASLDSAATALQQEHRLRPEDAWLGALVRWAYACPEPQARQAIARSLTGFVQDNQRFAFEDEAQTAALTIARQILNEG